MATNCQFFFLTFIKPSTRIILDINLHWSEFVHTILYSKCFIRIGVTITCSGHNIALKWCRKCFGKPVGFQRLYHLLYSLNLTDLDIVEIVVSFFFKNESCC